MKVWLENDVNSKLTQAHIIHQSALYISENVRVRRIRVVHDELFITTDVPAERSDAWLVKEA